MSEISLAIYNNCSFADGSQIWRNLQKYVGQVNIQGWLRFYLQKNTKIYYCPPRYITCNESGVYLTKVLQLHSNILANTLRHL